MNPPGRVQEQTKVDTDKLGKLGRRQENMPERPLDKKGGPGSTGTIGVGENRKPGA